MNCSSQSDIIPICMPAHSSHLLQSLDISCLAVLKRSYGQLVETIMRLRINHINKLDFLGAYPHARIKAFTFQTIKVALQQLFSYHLTLIKCFQISIFVLVHNPPPCELGWRAKSQFVHQNPFYREVIMLASLVN